MRRPFSPSSSRAVAGLGGLGFLLIARICGAHILMTAPLDWLVTNSEGDPQKLSPCGADSTIVYTASNKTNTVTAGQNLTVNWTETVPHDGHFRIALATARTDLKDPAVTKYTTDGSEAITVATSTAYPILADGLFEHTAASVTAGKTYTYTVKIPANLSCTHCTLQLLQFMANHPLDPSFFYHHCADMTVLAAPGTDAGAPGGTSGGAAGAGTTGAGGGPSTGAGGGTATGVGGGPSTGAGGGTATGAGGSGTTGAAGSVATGAGGGVSTGSGGSSGGTASSSSGCSCETGGGSAGLAGSGLLVVALLIGRRIRRPRRR